MSVLFPNKNNEELNKLLPPSSRLVRFEVSMKFLKLIYSSYEIEENKYCWDIAELLENIVQLELNMTRENILLKKSQFSCKYVDEFDNIN